MSPLSLVLGVWNVRTTCRKSWPSNLFWVLNFTFDPCFKVKFSHPTKRPYISLIIGPQASKCENTSWEVMACEFFPSIKFDIWPLLQGQVGHHIKKALYLPFYWSKFENNFFSTCLTPLIPTSRSNATIYCNGRISPLFCSMNKMAVILFKWEIAVNYMVQYNYVWVILFQSHTTSTCA